MEIVNLSREHFNEVLEMMRTFYASDAVSTNGSEEIFKNDIEACISDSPYLEGYVFYENTVIVGYAMTAKSFSTEFGKKCIWIEDLYLKPDWRNKGFGSKFLSFIEQKHRDAILKLEVEDYNLRAVHTYKKNGFELLPYAEMKK